MIPMTDEQKKAWAIRQLQYKAQELGRPPIKADFDDATRAIPVSSMPLSTAEKKVQARTGERPIESSRVRQHTGMQQSRQITGVTPLNTAGRENDAILRAQQRRKVMEKKREDERSRVATTAVVICCAVGVVAIILFLVAIFNGFLLNKEKDLVEVPYLEGKMYSEYFTEEYKDFNIRLQPRRAHPLIHTGRRLQGACA